jgi:hypothetical protein
MLARAGGAGDSLPTLSLEVNKSDRIATIDVGRSLRGPDIPYGAVELPLSSAIFRARLADGIHSGGNIRGGIGGVVRPGG